MLKLTKKTTFPSPKWKKKYFYYYYFYITCFICLFIIFILRIYIYNNLIVMLHYRHFKFILMKNNN